MKKRIPKPIRGLRLCDVEGCTALAAVEVTGKISLGSGWIVVKYCLCEDHNQKDGP